jgi:hypothetical protein
MRRRYRLLTFRKNSRGYLSLIVEYQDGNSTWHSRVVKSYGISTPEMLIQAQNDLGELERLAINESDPVPIGTVNEVIWASFYQTLQNPLASLPLVPLGIARDLSHLAASIITSVSGDLEAQINVTQPTMEPWERQRFSSWLLSQLIEEQRAILAYQWKYALG